MSSVSTMESMFYGVKVRMIKIRQIHLFCHAHILLFFFVVLDELWSKDFNQDISGWDVSKVENMSNMFQDATVCMMTILQIQLSLPCPYLIVFFVYLWSKAFNQDISGWDVSKVGNMGSMFFSSSVSMAKRL